MIVDLLALVLSFLAGYWFSDRFHASRARSAMRETVASLPNYRTRRARAQGIHERSS